MSYNEVIGFTQEKIKVIIAKGTEWLSPSPTPNAISVTKILQIEDKMKHRR